MQFSSPAWRIKVRDQWIGWDDATRRLRLQHVVNNSRFLVLAQIDNLASKMLSGVMRQLQVTGLDNTAWSHGPWKQWWSANVFMEAATGLPTFKRLDKPAAAGAWT